MAKHIYFQPNEKDKKCKVNDCSIRALCKYFDIEWIEAYKMLNEEAMETQTMPNDLSNIKRVLEKHNITFIGCKNDKVTVSKFADCRRSKAIAYIRVGYRTHLVCVDNGEYYDTWDSGDKLLYGYWG